MSKATIKEVRALLETASEMFDETGCVPGFDGEEVRAETMVPDAKEYISESIDNPEVCDSETWDRPGSLSDLVAAIDSERQEAQRTARDDRRHGAHLFLTRCWFSELRASSARP